MLICFVVSKIFAYPCRDPCVTCLPASEHRTSQHKTKFLCTGFEISEKKCYLFCGATSFVLEVLIVQTAGVFRVK